MSADAVKVVFEGDGYNTDPDVAAEWIRQTCVGWLELVEAAPLGLEDLITDHLEEDE